MQLSCHPALQVFERVARPVVQGALDGFNGVVVQHATKQQLHARTQAAMLPQASSSSCARTLAGTIFAYGQTGSGKTFTITGGLLHYSDRGTLTLLAECAV